jgi:hypothetical protein
MGQAGALEDPSGEQLVVRCEERSGRVQHRDPPCGENAERPEAVFDAVELGPHVEASECDVRRRERADRVAGCHVDDLESAAANRGELQVGRTGLAGHDRDAHGDTEQVKECHPQGC